MAKRVIIILCSILIIGFATGYYFYNKGHINLKSNNSPKISAPDLYRIFIKDTNTAKKYVNTILEVNGEVAKIDTNFQKQLVVLLKTDNENSFINCTMEEKISKIKINDKISIKGICSGMGEGDIDFGIFGDIYLTRCYHPTTP